MKQPFAIGIPTINRFDLLKPALLYYLIDYPNTQIYIVDNGNQGLNSDADLMHKENIFLTTTKANLGVAASWNLLCSKIYENHEYALILNDDIYLGLNENYISLFCDSIEVYDAYYTSPDDHSVMLIPKFLYRNVGGFDDLFYPAYYEDNDFQYRCSLNHFSRFELPFLKPAIYRNTSSISLDENLNKSNETKQRYIKKWGGLPNEEKFKKPFNR